MMNETTAEQHLENACRVSRVVYRAIEHNGQTSLLNYVMDLVPEPPPTFQSRQDLLEAVARHARPVLGDNLANAVVRQLEQFPVVLTANHHGVDFFSQSVQGSMIFSLPGLFDSQALETVPVFAFGNIPLNNVTFPRGLLLYNVNGSDLAQMPLKLPIFSDRLKRSMVSAAPAIDQGMVARAEKRVQALAREEKICGSLTAPVRSLFNEAYAAPEVLNLPSYSLQSILLNHAVWERLFASGVHHPEMVYLEIEKLVSDMLVEDLADGESLAHMVMFERAVRQRILDRLDGNRVCWDTRRLIQRLETAESSNVSPRSFHGGGTHFFWGIDSRHRRIPLLLIPGKGGNDVLSGIDDSGKKWQLSFTGEAIVDALHRKQVLPSLFTCFLSIAFARGMICAGGYFQADYLPTLKDAVVSALAAENGFEDVAERVAVIPMDRYLSGMQAVMKRVEGDRLVPAGPLEIIASGGLTSSNVETIMETTVKEAHLGALFETVPDLLPQDARAMDWKEKLAQDCHLLLKDRLVVK